jgi:EAL domain-containing protein (putative c-di-GMP-specific phosphodiesterase class I)
MASAHYTTELENHLTKGIESQFKMERVIPYFQPIMNLLNNRVWRYECLARLLGESEHIFLPSDFLNLVEKKNMNADLTHHIYEESRRYCAQRNMPWSINLSDSDLDDESLVAWLIHQHENSSSTLFGIEISHTCLQSHLPVLSLLRQKCPNLAISIDDVAYLSPALEKALSLKLTAIKLSGKLMNDESLDKVQLRELIASCKSSRTKVVAEHIESQEMLDTVTSCGIEFGQGYFLSSPAASV